MALFTSGHRRRQPRRFDYEPRFYDPKKEERERRNIRIHRRTLSRRRSPLGIIYLMILLGMVLFIYNALG